MGLDSNFYVECGYLRKCWPVHNAFMYAYKKVYNSKEACDEITITYNILINVEYYLKEIEPIEDKYHKKQWKKIHKKIRKYLSDGIYTRYEGSW